MGVQGAVLPILCRPASVEPTVDVPDALEVVGWPTGVAHDVGGEPYGRARAAAFMGKRMVEDATGGSWAWVSELPSSAVESLPDELSGSAFLDRWGDHGDAATSVDPNETYPVRAATGFGGAEHCTQRRWHWTRSGEGDARTVGECMAASHAGYDAMGLGHRAAIHPGPGGSGEAGRPRGPVERGWLRRDRRRPV